MLPEIFKIGSISISGYSFFYVLALLACTTVVLILAKKEHLDVIECLNFLIFGIIIVVLGSRLYGVLFVFLKDPSLQDRHLAHLWEEFKTGGVFYGGVICGLIYSYFYLKKIFKGKEWQVADITVIGIALGHVFGRIGCFCAGCCYGKATTLPWGVKFPFRAGSPHKYIDTFVHPTQIYEAILNLLNFFILVIIWRKRKFRGRIFSLYLVNYGIIRFVVELFRNDGGRGYILFLSIPQIISLGFITMGSILYFKNSSRTILKPDPQE